MFLNPFSLKGRIRRTEYWLTNFIYAILYVTYIFMYEVVKYNNNEFAVIFIGLLFLPLWYILIAQSVKRSHDIGNSGWFNLIPFYGLFLLFSDSNEGDNKYGSNPKK
ncbi:MULTISPECIES: DUF805 domain-containing protein [Weeksellaceae]|uniref:Uncharacterized membrane protein YhaH, DUF805 family n=1 Tax=Algoriella xinjiangensis TaxID=684065 RepID=A0A1I4XRY7_9FLAO|nr:MULTISPECIES: DUF805 domain-containing protein [Weeksellaceae]SFN28547.1 Uncharacterized membrane protein YhaH, DUF805 family [Algoriella xinjiangensis]